MLIGASVAFFIVGVDPIYQEIRGLQKEAEAFNAALSKSRELQEVRDELLAKYNSFSVENLERLEKLLPDNVDNVRLIMDINNIATRYGMSIKSTTISEMAKTNTSGIVGDPGAEQKTYGSIMLSFSVSSPYETFLAFINDLERSLRLVDIKSISFIAGETDFYQYNVKIETYWLK